MVSDSVRLPNGKITTFARARSRGWVDAEGNLTDAAPRPTREQAEIEKRARAIKWRKDQGLPALAEDSPEEQAALAGKPARKVKPLKPQNVTPEGEPITDKALLDEIAAKTAAIEKAAQS